MSVILITGTSTGLGMAASLVLARSGHQVYASMRNPEGAPELQNTANQENLPITVLQLDVDSEKSVAQAITSILEKEGKIDVLVNNAGIAISGPVEELALEEFQRSMDTNFLGPIRCIQKVLPSMRERRSGYIINISSVAGKIATPPQAPYAASKFALEALSEVLAQEVKSFKIKVAIVEPGIIETPIFGKMRDVPADTKYPHEKRLNALFATARQQPVSANIVGEKILEIMESNDGQLRYPVGPDSEPFLAWRAQMSDEEWISWGATESDEDWCAKVEADFGMNVRPALFENP